MPKKPTTPARPRDMNQLAHRIGQLATGEATETGKAAPKKKRLARGSKK